jgi:hypothetical protein
MTAIEVYEFIFGEFAERHTGEVIIIPGYVKSQLYYLLKEDMETADQNITKEDIK